MMKNAWLLAGALCLPIAVHAQVKGEDARKPPAPSVEKDAAKSRTPPPPPDCTAADTTCNIPVKVGPKCKITVKDKYVVAHHPASVQMIWTIDGDAVFGERGIDFKSASFKPQKKEYRELKLSNPSGVFKSKKGGAGQSSWEETNTGKPGLYYYMINIVQGGNKCPSYDPGVVNQ